MLGPGVQVFDSWVPTDLCGSYLFDRYRGQPLGRSFATEFPCLLNNDWERGLWIAQGDVLAGRVVGYRHASRRPEGRHGIRRHEPQHQLGSRGEPQSDQKPSPEMARCSVRRDGCGIC